MYPPPYPYTYPVPIQPIPQQPVTSKGLQWVSRSIYVYLGVLLLNLAIGVAAAWALGVLLSGDLTIIGPLFAIIAAGIGVAVMGIIVCVFYLIGLGYLYKGRNEHGPAHARNVQIAFYLLIGAIVVTIVGAVVSVAFSFSMWTPWTPIDPGTYYAMAASSIIFGIVAAAMVAGMLALPVRALMRPEHQTFVYAAAGLGTATPGITGAITLYQLPDILELLQDSTAGVGVGMGLPGILAATLGFLTFVLFVIAYRGAERRILSGELKPIMPPPAPVSWMPAPVIPYPQPMWVPPQPWGPPPSQPPPPPPAPPPQQPQAPVEEPQKPREPPKEPAP